MTLSEKIKQSILKFLGLDKLSQNPNNDRYAFLGDEEKIIQTKIEECRVWYYGDSNELLNYYTAEDAFGNARNPIYNRNKVEYFWGINPKENHIKRVHSGVPNAIVTTITNIVGMPQIKSGDPQIQELVDKIIKETQLKNIINQKEMPMTLALGWGAFKPIIDKKVSRTMPLLEWYNADEVNFITKYGKVIGIVYKDFIEYQNEKYVFIETRRVVDGNSRIEYNLFKLNKDDSVQPVSLDTIPDLNVLKKDGLEINGYDKILGVPCVFFYDQNNTNYGRSIFAGKIDLFDDLDQDLSQASQTSRVSTPVEYVPVDLMERGKNGESSLPVVYNRQFIKSNAYPNGDGELVGGEITTTQPQLNFNQYNDKCLADLNFILTGILSPATMGLNIAKDDTALSQREKEKISIMTRNNIIDRQECILKDLMEVLIAMWQYINTGKIKIKDYDISIKFDEFATPTFETISGNLANLLSSGAISPEMYVDKLYGDSLSDEEKQREIEYIKERQQADTMDTSDFDINNFSGIDDNGTGSQKVVNNENQL